MVPKEFLVSPGDTQAMEFEKEILQQINEIYDDICISDPIDYDLIDIIGSILEKKPCPKLERMWRGYQEYLFEVGSDSVLFEDLLMAANRHVLI